MATLVTFDVEGPSTYASEKYDKLPLLLDKLVADNFVTAEAPDPRNYFEAHFKNYECPFFFLKNFTTSTFRLYFIIFKRPDSTAGNG